MSYQQPLDEELFYTDANGVRYARASIHTPWIELPSQVPPSNPQPLGFGAQNAGVQSSTASRHRDTFSHHNSFLPPSSSQAEPLTPYDGPGNQNNMFHFAADRLPVNPASVPLPEDKENDFPAPSVRAGQVSRPAMKVGGVRQAALSAKAKGKQKAVDNASASGSGVKRKAAAPPSGAPEAKKARGRAAGAANYSAEDVDSLLDILEEALPLGGYAWNSCTDEFNKWAEENGRPARTCKSLELKYKQLVRTSKPTGDAYCPPHIERAHQIEDMMNDKAGSRDLDDDDIIDAYDEDDIAVGSAVAKEEDGDEVIAGSEKVEKVEKAEKAEKAEKKVKAEKDGPMARRLTTTGGQTSRRATGDLLQSISTALDPRARQARHEESTMASMQAAHVFQLSSENRELRRQNDSLRTRLSDAERRADRAELLRMIHPSHSPSHSRRSPSPSYSRRSRSRFRSRSHSRVHSRPRSRVRSRSHSRVRSRSRSRSCGRSGLRSRVRSRTLSRIRRECNSWQPTRPGRSPIPYPGDISSDEPPTLQRRDVFYPDGGRAVEWVGHPEDRDAFVRPETPGTYYRNLDDFAEPGPSSSQHASSSSTRPASPFRSAASSLNNLLNPTSSHEEDADVVKGRVYVSEGGGPEDPRK